MIRYTTIFLFLSGFGFKVFCQTPEPSKDIDYSGNDSVNTKTTLIGNVTELSYGYNWFNPEDLFGHSVNQYTAQQARSITLTQYFIINNFLIQSGVEISMYQANYSSYSAWDSIVSSQITVYDTINTHYYIVDGDSIPEYVIEQYTSTQKDTIGEGTTNNITNKISCFTIPLNMGYRWRFNKFALYMKVGSRFNFISSSKGKIYTAKSDDWFELSDLIQKKFYMSGTASLAFEYPFSALGSLIIEPEYRYSWFSRINPAFVNNYQQLGVKMGVQLWF